ncbi:MAG: transposase family protein [Cyclobacteriaceae bacterium]
MQTIQNNSTDHPDLLKLTSLHPAEFMQLLSVFDPLCRDYFRHFDLEGNLRRISKFEDDARCSLPGSTEKLLFILVYIKENPRQHYQGQLFGMQQPRLSKWIKLLLPLLEKALKKLAVLPKRFGYALYAFLQTFTRNVLLMDATGCRTRNALYPDQ